MHKLTSKRQVTLPKTLCDSLGLNPGDYVEFFERDGVAYLVKMTDNSLAGAFAELILTQGKAMPSTDGVKQAIRQRAAKKFERQP